MTRILALLTIVLAASTAHAEDLQMNDPHFKVLIEVVHSIDEAFDRDDKTKSWLVSGNMEGARCTRALAAATKGGAEIHVVHRYQFDATHKLVKTTDTQYCGKVPARAFK